MKQPIITSLDELKNALVQNYPKFIVEGALVEQIARIEESKIEQNDRTEESKSISLKSTNTLPWPLSVPGLVPVLGEFSLNFTQMIVNTFRDKANKELIDVIGTSALNILCTEYSYKKIDSQCYFEHL